MNKQILLILLSIVSYPLLAVGFASAHGSPFFEFNPDSFTTSSLTILTSEPIAEVFIPQNDYLNGVDLWLSNANTASSVTLRLYNPTGTLLSTRTVSLPAIPDNAGGQRVHADLTGQLAVVSTNKYTLRITTSDPTLKIWYAPRTFIVQHNGPVSSAYQNGVAEIGSQEKDFSFKFALYEIAETTAPALSNVAAAVLSPTEVRIDLNANEPIDYKIDFGPDGQGYTQSSNFSGEYTFCAVDIDVCRRPLTVSAGTTYNFLLTAKDAWGNQTTAQGTFTTPTDGTETPTPSVSASSTPTPTPTADITPPAISQFHIVSLTNKRVQVAWTTNEAANSAFTISELPLFLAVAAGTDGTFELEHFMDSGDVLSGDSNYQIKVTSRDSANNLASQSLTFKAPSYTPTPATPTPSTPPASPTVQPSQSPGATTLTWTASPEDADGYRVDIFDSSNNLIRSVAVPPGTTSISIADLPDGQHTAVIYASSSGAFKKVAPPVSLKVDRRSLLEKLLDPKNIAIGVAIVLLIILVVIIIIKRRRAPDTPAKPAPAP